MTDHTVEWRIDAANSRLVRTVTYGWVGLLGGGVLLALGLVLLFAVGAAIGGEYALAALVVLLLLVGGPFSLLYLWPAVRSGSFSPLSKFVLDTASDPEEPLAERYADAFSWRGAVASVGLHAVGIPTLAFVDPRLLGGYVAVSFVLLVLTSVLQTWGRIDAVAPSFEYRSGTIPLSAIEQVHRWQVRGVVVCRLSYRPGVKTITTPSWVVLTPEAADAFETARSAAGTAPSDHRPSRRAPRVVALGIGLGAIAFAGWTWLAVDLDPGVGTYLLVVFGGLGSFLAWVGLRYA